MNCLRYAVGVLGIATLGFIQTAQAVPLFFGFDVAFDLGPLSGQTAHGTIAVDSTDCVGGCTGTFTPSDPAKELVSFHVTVGGLSFNSFNDTSFSTGLFPYVTFTNNQVSVFDYMGLQNGLDGVRQLNLSYAFGSGSALFYDPNFGPTDPSFGSITATGQVVPEPASLPLLAAAMILLVMVTRARNIQAISIAATLAFPVLLLSGCGGGNDSAINDAVAQTSGAAPIQWDLKNARVIDLSHVQQHDMPADPSLTTPTMTFFARIGQGAGAFWNLENITYTPHTGTHMDTPFHVNSSWGAAETLDPTLMIGPAAVVSIPAGAGHVITAAEIQAWEAANGPIQQGDGVLLHTGFDSRWPDMTTYIINGYPTLSKDAAQYIVSKKARYVGMETISPDGPNTDTHQILLGNNVMILENLTGISNIGKPRCWTMGTFPNIRGASGVYIRLLAVVNQ